MLEIICYQSALSPGFDGSAVLHAAHGSACCPENSVTQIGSNFCDSPVL